MKLYIEFYNRFIALRINAELNRLWQQELRQIILVIKVYVQFGSNFTEQLNLL